MEKKEKRRAKQKQQKKKNQKKCINQCFQKGGKNKIYIFYGVRMVDGGIGTEARLRDCLAAAEGHSTKDYSIVKIFIKQQYHVVPSRILPLESDWGWG